MRQIRRPKRLTLHRALKIGYLRNERKQAKRLKRFGYRIDPELTTGNYLTAYNAAKNKLIFVENGTNPTSVRDLYTDVAGIGAGRLASTSRYKTDYTAYLKAKDKYKDVPVTLVGHSLGGSLVTEMAQAGDRAIAYGAPYTKKKENVYSYRTAGDPFSAFNSQAKTLENPATLAQRLNPIQPHSVSNLADKPIFV